MAKTRDWQAYDLYRTEEEMLFLEKAEQVVWGMDAPWEPKNGGRNGGKNGGRPCSV